MNELKEFRKEVNHVFINMTKLIFICIDAIDELNEKVKHMDKKMHQVTKRMETAEKDIKKGNKKEAVKVLEKAKKKNEKLVKIDKTQRDPVMHAVEKEGHCEGKQCVSKVKSALKMKKGK